MIQEQIKEYQIRLRQGEKEERTIRQYTRYIEEYIKLANIKEVADITKESLIEYKDFLTGKYKTNTINIKLVIINAFLDHLELAEYKLKLLKKQQKNTIENVLSQIDYERLLRIAQARGKVQAYYLMETLAETGIRVSELEYITVEAVKNGVAIFNSKGTVERKAFITKHLQKELLSYCKDAKITTGIIFKSKNNKPLDNAYIYKEIQYIARTSPNKERQSTPS